MKKFRSILLAAFMVITAACTAFASPEAPTDTEVMAAFKHATTVFEWFEHDPLPTDGKERFDSGYMMYYSVSDPKINTMLALKQEVHNVFTDSLSSFIISGNKMYRQTNEKLFVAPAAKKADPLKGTSTFTISRPSAEKIVVTAQTPIYTAKDHKTLARTQVTEFPYVKTAKGWRFSYFESLK
jgi:hypothetical protein